MKRAARKRWTTFERIMLCVVISVGAFIVIAAGLILAVLGGLINLK